MKTFEVTVRMVVTKTYTVEAEDEDRAVEECYEIAGVLEDGAPEDYQQDVLSVKEVIHAKELK